MRIICDESADAAYIRLIESGDGAARRTVPCDVDAHAIVLDFDRDDRLIGIEILDARTTLPVQLLKTTERSRADEA